VGFLLVVEEQIDDNLEGRLKASIVTFNCYWRVEKVGCKPILACFFASVVNLYIFLC
jgi:hypothetical protein